MRCAHPVTGPARMRCSSAHLQERACKLVSLPVRYLFKQKLLKSSESSFPVIRRGRREVGKVIVTNRWLLMTCRWKGSRDFLFSGDRVREKEYSFFFLMKTAGDLESGPVPAVGAEVCPVLFSPGNSFPKLIERRS